MPILHMRAAVFAVSLMLAMPAWSSSTVTNGILRITIENNTADPYFGEFDVSTGPSHPHPNQTVLYPFGTSFITLRDVGATTMWVNSGDPTSAGLGGYVLKNLNTNGAVTRTFVALGTSGFRATWTLPGFVIAQDVTIVGTTLADTRVDHKVSITNTNEVAVQYGLRYLWDWEIANNDGSFFRTRNPDGAFSSSTAQFNAPGFQYYEEVDNIATPTFSIFGSVLNGSPTPEVLRYSDWPTTDDFAWGYTDPASAAGDSSVTYYWGFANPLSLAVGATATYVESISTQQSAIGPPPPPPPATTYVDPIPTLSDAGLALLSMLLLFAAAWSRRRAGGR
jgi:hypothetical protein